MFYALSFVIGFLLPFQTGLNSRVKNVVASAFLASLVSFFIGLSLLCVLLLLNGYSINFMAWNYENARFWHFFGGFLGVFGISAAILLFAKLGAILPIVLLVLGQIVSSVIIDIYGLLDMQIKNYNAFNFLGFFLVFIGCSVVICFKDKNFKLSFNPALWLLGILVGVAFSVQACINTNLSNHLFSSLKAAFISFGIAFSVLCFIAIFVLRNFKNLLKITLSKEPFYIYFGGIFGALYVYAITIITPIIGVANASVWSLFGMIVGGIIIDMVGLFGVLQKSINKEQILGFILLFIGVWMLKITF
ncbi:DMT family transporter [Campylobacter majalis]|uniref:DMT family transporter n=1 Tax=Campylobacter majalis TaxID=2790656 RepID=UPI003D6853B8